MQLPRGAFSSPSPLGRVNPVMYAVFIPPAGTTDGYGIFNMRTNLGACRTHEGGGGGGRHKQVCTSVDSETEKTTLHPEFRHGIEPRVVGLEFRCTNHRATSPAELHDGNCLRMQTSINDVVKTRLSSLAVSCTAFQNALTRF